MNERVERVKKCEFRSEQYETYGQVNRCVPSNACGLVQFREHAGMPVAPIGYADHTFSSSKAHLDSRLGWTHIEQAWDKTFRQVILPAAIVDWCMEWRPQSALFLARLMLRSQNHGNAVLYGAHSLLELGMRTRNTVVSKTPCTQPLTI